MDQPPPRGVPAWSTRQVVYATLFILSVLIAFWLLYRFSRIVFVLFVAIVLGTAIRPGVDWLNQRGLPRSAGVILIYLLLFSLFVGLVVLIAPLLADQVIAIAYEIPTYYNEFRVAIFQSPSRILQRIAIQLPTEMGIQPEPAPESETQALDRVAQSLTYAGIAARGAITLVAVFLLGFYWTLESERTIRNLLLWLPMKRRDEVRDLIEQIEVKVGGFIIGQSILCLSIGAMALIAYLIIGLPYALILAILAGLMEAVPVFGPILGAVPALLVALSLDPTKAIWVVVATAVIQSLENYLLVPRVMNRSVGVNPLVTLLALAAFTSLLGLPGALLAVPMAAIIQLLLDRFVLMPPPTETQVPAGRDQLSLLRYEARDLAQDIRKLLSRKADTTDGLEEVEDSVEAIANDLDRILARVSGMEDNE